MEPAPCFYWSELARPVLYNPEISRRNSGRTHSALNEEVQTMIVDRLDFSQCVREEKQLIEGFCLSYDLLRGLCLETLQPCSARETVPEPDPSS